ncbi:WD40 repeat-like protein [Morchella conica CCBAS932]|uniref:WD40 repeat-like protein n=1 Tax=Morchella conica CCBAS932 TaxID=1392247 RepID=A0A3N4KSX1_9PEZI|nr:WD40 repeat-like protein [Morchella conica CCBAS932]
MAVSATDSTPDHPEDEPQMLNPDEAAEEIPEDADGDVPMDSDDENAEYDAEAEELEITNDSKAYFDKHSDSIFSIAAHPSDPSIFLTGGGDDVAYIWTPDMPANTEDANITPRESKTIVRLSGHKDSVTAAAFTNPDGAYAVTGGLDGKIQVYAQAEKWKKTAEAQEVEEINWIQPHPTAPLFALGANDGSVWIYSLETGGLEIKQALYSHTASCSAGAWTSDGKILCTVSQDGSFYAWETDSGRAVVALTSADQRFAVEGGLYSVTVSPSGAVAVVGGATGEMRVVGLPSSTQAASGAQRRGAGRPQAGGGGSTGGGQVGQIIASLHTHSESVESLCFHPTQPLLASAGVDGKIVIYDAARGFPVRRTLEDGHKEAVVKVEFVKTDGWILTSCSIDGTLRRWDVRAGTELGCWKGHLGGNQSEGEGGILGFVQTKDRVVTAGDDHVSLVFEMTGLATGGGSVAPTVGGPALR